MEDGIEQWLKHTPQYVNYDGWQNLMMNHNRGDYQLDTANLMKSLKELRKNNYSIDFWGWKGYVIYDARTSIYYPIMVLNCVGYVVGCDVCVMNICYSDGRSAGMSELSDAEIKSALKKFKKNILPQVKKYVPSSAEYAK